MEEFSRGGGGGGLPLEWTFCENFSRMKNFLRGQVSEEGNLPGKGNIGSPDSTKRKL